MWGTGSQAVSREVQTYTTLITSICIIILCTSILQKQCFYVCVCLYVHLRASNKVNTSPVCLDRLENNTHVFETASPDLTCGGWGPARNHGQLIIGPVRVSKKLNVLNLFYLFLSGLQQLTELAEYPLL